MATNHIIFTLRPELLAVPKMEKFMNNNYHLTFEKADLLNNVEWFEVAKSKGYLAAMTKHMDCTYPTFKWKNYRAWLKTI